jgi:hypothetical protein
MSYLKDEQLLKYVLETYCHVEYFVDDWQRVKEFLNHQSFPNRNSKFKQELAETISNHSLSTKELDLLTANELETQEEVNEFLLNEIWKPLYGDEPITP